MASTTRLAWPFFDDRHRRFAEALSRWADAKLPSLPHDDVDAACRALVKALGEAGWLKAVVPAGAWRPASGARRAHALPRPRDPGLPRRPRRFRLRHAGARHRPDHAVRHRGAEARAICRRCATARRSPPSRCRSRRRAPTSRRWPPRRRPTARPCPARRREDLDLERRHRRPLRRLRAHRRGAGRARAVGLRRRCRHAGADDRRAHRGDRAASAGDARVRRLPRAARRNGSASPARASRSRWRRSTCSARRSAPRRSALRAARWTRRSSTPRRASCSARRSAICS